MQVNTIAIIDDEQESRSSLALTVRQTGRESVEFDRAPTSTDEFVHRIRDSAEAAICDHRLDVGDFGATFTGAQLAAQLYDADVPAILVSEYVSTDLPDIRMYRRKMPVLVHADQYDEESIEEGLRLCERELADGPSFDRRPFRALVHVKRLVEFGSRRMVSAFVPDWNERAAISFPDELIDESLRSTLKEDVRYWAQVNTGASKAEDLYLDGFELAHK